MASLEVCLACLEVGVKMYNIDDCEKRSDFNLVAGLSTFKGCGLPYLLCYQCFALVTKFMTFRKKCQKTYHHLTVTRRRYKKLTSDNIRKLNREKLGLKSTLSMIKLGVYMSNSSSDKIYDNLGIGTGETIVYEVNEKCDINDEIYKRDVQESDDLQYEEEYIEDEDEFDFVDLGYENQTTEANEILDYDKQFIFVDQIEIKDEKQVDNDYENDDSDIINVDNGDQGDEGVVANELNIDNNVIADGMVIDEDYATAYELSKEQQRLAFDFVIRSGVGKLKCSVCKQGHKNKKALEVHMKRHEKHVSGIYCCDICQFYFLSEYLLKSHVERKHLYKYVCKICPKVTYSRSKAKHHYSTHRGKIGTAHRQRENIKPKRQKEKIVNYTCGRFPKDIQITPIGHLEQYKLVEERKMTRNYIESLFKCELCYKGFRNNTTFSNHNKKHDPTFSGPLECDVCKLRFKDIRQMHKHICVTHLYRYSCRICDFFCYSDGAALSHHKWHNNVTYPCPHCDAVFTKISTRLTHIRVNHPSTVICILCGHSFISEVGLYFHNQKKHTEEDIEQHEIVIKTKPEQSLYCRECELQFSTQEAFDVHLGSSSKHVKYNVSASPYFREKGKNRTFVGRAGISTDCEECGLTLPNESQARKHYKAEHPDVKYLKRFMCDICGHKTQQYVNLEVHMRVHTKEKPFECKYCGRKFATISSRDRHLVVHTGERKYQCQICEKRFTQNGVLKLHVQTVHMKIPHPAWDRRNRKRREALNISKPEPVSESEIEIDTQVEYLEDF